MYSGCNKKITAREMTVIGPYREIFKQQSLPMQKQFISLCGLCCDVDKGNILLKDSELDHILKSRLLESPSQYHGIDANPDTISANKLISDFVGSTEQPNWYCKYFKLGIDRIAREEWFNPGIINYDCTVMPEKAMGDLKQIINLTKNKNDILVVCNFVTRARHKTCSPEELFEIIKTSGLLDLLNRDQWVLHEVIYQYNGTGKSSNTTMSTIVFYKKTIINTLNL
jgi:hypothetical protein